MRSDNLRGGMPTWVHSDRKGRSIMRRMDLHGRANQPILDGCIFILSFAAAYLIRFEGLPAWTFTKQFLLWIPYLVGLRLLINWRLGIYRFVWRYVSLSDVIAITRSLAIVTVLLLALRLFYPEWAPLAVRFRISLSVIALEFLLSLASSIGVRALWRILHQQQEMNSSNGAERKPVLLIGAGNAGVRVAREIISSGDFKLIGFLDDDREKIGTLISGIPVIGPMDSLPSVVKEQGIKQVIICIPRPPRATLKRLWAFCDSLPVETKIVPTLGEILHGSLNVAALRNVQIADLLGRETIDLSEGADDVATAYRDKRILITGAGGTIGSELSHQLLGYNPKELILLDKDENGLFEFVSQFGATRENSVIHPVVADIRSSNRIGRIFAHFQPEVVFHAAAHKHVSLMEINPCEAMLNNVFGTQNVVRHADEAGVSIFVLISTDKAVKPRGFMGASKRLCEMIVRAQNHNASSHFSCVRFGNVMGSRGSVIPLFQTQIARGGPVTVTHPEAMRYMMTVPEAVQLVLLAATLRPSEDVHVLDMGDPVSIMGLARDLIELSGLRPDKDIRIETINLRPGEKLSEELFDSSSETPCSTRWDKIWAVRGQSFDKNGFEQRLVQLKEAVHRESLDEINQILGELEIGFSPITKQHATY